MADINVNQTGETENALQFDVDVTEAGSSSRHVVTLQREGDAAFDGVSLTPSIRKANQSSLC